MPRLRSTVARIGASTVIPPCPDSQLTSLLAGAGRGDLDSFAAFYDATAGSVYGVALTLVRSPGLAARLTQEIYVEVWRDPQQLLDRKVTVLAVLVAMTHRRAVTAARSDENSPLRQGGRRGRLSLTRVTRLDRPVLTELQQEIVVLSYLGGYTVREVAALLDVAPSAVRDALTGALTGLRDATLATAT